MTPFDLAPIRARLEKAKVSPWREAFAAAHASDDLCDAALGVTTTDIPGSALTVNREKMRLRLRAAVNHLMEAGLARQALGDPTP